MLTTPKDNSKANSRSADQVPSFIKKSYQILEEGKFPDIVEWNEEGNAIVIKKPQDFAKKVLPTYFKHNNLTSFVRQLNMYDFHKRRTQKYDHVYYHDLFLRDKKHLLKDVKRKNQENTLANIQKAIETLETVQNNGQLKESGANSYENQLLKKLNKDALGRIKSLEEKVKDLTIQNQALWNHINHQKQKEDVLVGFLANFMKTKGISLDQLPKVLNKQFTPHQLDLNENSDIKIFENKTNMNVADFLNLSEESSSSTEETYSSPLIRGKNDIEEFYKSSLENTPNIDTIIQPETRNQNMLDNNEITYQQISNNQYNQVLLGKRSQIEVERFGKINSGENIEAQLSEKHVKKDYHIEQYLNPFVMNQNTVNQEDFENIKSKPMSGFSELYAFGERLPSMGIDLMDFSHC